MKRAHIVVSGSVQGVFFRSFTKDTADSLNITGYAKNLSDGSVEIIAEGEEKDILMLIDACRHGTEHSHISRCETTWSESKREFDDFSIQ